MLALYLHIEIYINRLQMYNASMQWSSCIRCTYCKKLAGQVDVCAMFLMESDGECRSVVVSDGSSCLVADRKGQASASAINHGHSAGDPCL